MKKIGIYGGSFDPVHVDHINICKEFFAALNLDKIYVVPARLSPFKEKSGAGAEDRLNMLKLAFADCAFVEISRFELDSDFTNYSYLTVEHFADLYPDAKLYFLIGGDSLNSFDRWKNPQIIAGKATVCVAGRKGEDTAASTDIFYNKYGYKPINVHFEGTCSSTEAREYISLGLAVTGFLPPSVYNYIKEKDLYVPDEYHIFLKEHSKPARLIHTVGVEMAARRYAERTGYNADKAMFAALLHDVAKYLNKAEYPDFKSDADVPGPIVHQFLGAYVAEHILGVTDPEVLNAIKWHTTGRPRMSLLEKIIYTADLLEANRTFSGVEVLRTAVENDFESGFRLCVHELYKFLTASGGEVYYMSKLTDEYYNPEYYGG